MEKSRVRVYTDYKSPYAFVNRAIFELEENHGVALEWLRFWNHELELDELDRISAVISPLHNRPSPPTSNGWPGMTETETGGRAWRED